MIKLMLTNVFFQHLKSLHLLYDPNATFGHVARNIAYSNLIVLTILSSLICIILIAVSYILSYSTVKNAEQASEYECGFDPFDTATRRPFEVHFYVVGILFLIFDVEIALIFPWVLSLNAVSWFGFYIMLIFLFAVSLGFVAEWHRGVLTWPKYLSIVGPVSREDCEKHWQDGGRSLMQQRRGENGYEMFAEYFLKSMQCGLPPHLQNTEGVTELPSPEVKAYLDYSQSVYSGAPMIPESPFDDVIDYTAQFPETSTLVRLYKEFLHSVEKEFIDKSTASEVPIEEDFFKKLHILSHWFRGSREDFINSFPEFEHWLEENIRQSHDKDPKMSQEELDAIVASIPNGVSNLKDYLLEMREMLIEDIMSHDEWKNAGSGDFEIYGYLFEPIFGPDEDLGFNTWEEVEASTKLYYEELYLTGAGLLRDFDLDIDSNLFYSTLEYAFYIVNYHTVVNEPSRVSYLLSRNSEQLESLFSYSRDVYWYAVPEVLMLVFIMLIVFLSSSAYRFCKPSNFSHFAVKQINVAVRFLALVVITYIWLLIYHIDSDTKCIMFGDNVVIDLYTTICKLLVLLLAALVLSLSRRYVSTHPRNIIDFATYILLGTFFLTILISANSLMTVLFGIMGFSYNLYVLIAADSGRESIKPLNPAKSLREPMAQLSHVSMETRPTQTEAAVGSTEAAIKYFTLSALSSGLISAALSLVWVLTGTLNFSKLYWIISFTVTSSTHNSVTLWDFILIFLVYGFLFKLAAYPCHLWAPDVYSGTPGPVLAYVMLPVKLGVFSIFAKLLLNVFRELYSVWSMLLIIAALGSLVWGCLGAYKTFLVKKFLAYSSMNQIGFVLAGVACCSADGLGSSFVFLFLYIVSQIIIFQFILNVSHRLPIYVNKAASVSVTVSKEIAYLHEFQLASWHTDRRPYILGLCIIFFSMAGIPPLGGFFGKYLVLNSVFRAGYTGLVITCMVTSMVSAYYYLRVIKIMTFGFPMQSDETDSPHPKTTWHFDLGQYQSYLFVAILTILIIFPFYYNQVNDVLRTLSFTAIFNM